MRAAAAHDEKGVCGIDTLGGKRQPSAGAVRARRSRWRRRHGLAPYTIDADEHALAEALIAAGRLSEAEALRPEMVRRELSGLVNDFICRWRHGVTGP
jgi:hypothetical protein